MSTTRRVHRSAHRMMSRHDPQVGQLFVPNLNARVPNELGGYYVRTNSQGFRADIEFQEKKNHKLRFLCFGDSFTAGDLCSNHQRFSDILGTIYDAEVFNYGIPGSGPDQHLLVFERYAKTVEADLIILAIYAENIERIVVPARKSVGGRDPHANGRPIMVPKPYFTLEGEELHLNNIPVPLERQALDETTESSSLKGRLREMAPPALVNPFREIRRRAAEMRDRFPGLATAAYRAADYEPYSGYSSSETPDWQLMRAIVQRFAQAAGDRPLLIVPIPEFRYYYYQLRPRFQELFDTLASPKDNVHVANVTRSFYSLSRDEMRELSFQTNPHWTPLGHRRVADFIAREVRSIPLELKVHDKKSTPEPFAKKTSANYVLGISCFYHNSGASLIADGKIVAAAEEERFTRIKNDRSFPHSAINYCLEEAGIQQDDLEAVVYYDNPALTFERLMHTQIHVGEQGETMFMRVVPIWVRQKLHLPRLIRRYMQYEGKILQNVHHRSHGASAFFASPFDEAAILTIDGVGEWATATLGEGHGREFRLLKELRFPHSLGLLYSAFTQFIGFKVNSGEYKMMGLAPYGRPIYADIIREKLVDIKEDGSLELNMEYFGYLSQHSMISDKFAELFDGPPREPETRITRREMDIARSIQEVSEEVILKMARHLHELTGLGKLCMAGGVALNCVANGRVLREGPFDEIWIQPAAGDSGASLGAALDVYHTYMNKEREVPDDGRSAQGGSFLGPEFSRDEIRSFLDTYGYRYHELSEDEKIASVVDHLEAGRVVGHFSGKMEFGPRALGSRSIIGDARNPETQVVINKKIKYRESFRPFAPVVLEEMISDYFDIDRPSPYMLLVAPVREERWLPFELDYENEDLLEQVRKPRSDIPAITHVDYSARIQSVRREDHQDYYDVIKEFKEKTGCGVIVNTSFNVRGEPIVCTPFDAYRCFMRTEMDVLVLGPFILLKEEQPDWPEEKGHVEEYEELKQPGHGDAFTEEVRRVFQEKVLPASKLLNEEHRSSIGVNSEFRREPSLWVDCPEQHGTQEQFRFPDGMEQSEKYPSQMAAAICSQWTDGIVRTTLEPIIAELLAADRDHPATLDIDDELELEVSEYVYEMF